jgi:lysophospholipase L1-like esterase
MRRRLHLSIVGLVAVASATSCAPPHTVPLEAARPPAWIPTWAPSQSATALRPVGGTRDPVPTYANATIREIARTTIGGDRVRIRISNEYGDRPLLIGAAHIALAIGGSSINPATDRALTFEGKTSVIVRTGSVTVSDPIAFAVPTLGDVAVSFFLPDSARTTTRHALAVQTTYIARSGDRTGQGTFTADTTMRSWIFLSAIEVTNPRATGTIVAIGNSITDGFASTPDSNRRWPDVLARRLLTSPSEPVKAVINAGISGNRVLTLGAGPSLVSRFDRDVLMQPGVTHAIILEGINDISRDSIDVVSTDDIIAAMRELANRAHERGIVVYGATLTPKSTANAAREMKRQAVNEWIRTGGVFDGVIDFDAITRDPAQPGRLLPAYDSGDHLHPSDAGYAAMGAAIDLGLFRLGRVRR